MDNVLIKSVNYTDRDLHELISKLDCELEERYPKEGIFGLDFNDPEVNKVFFALAYVNDTPIGCGALRPLDSESVELKRFYVDRSYRNKGIAARLLTFLEDIASSKGYKVIKLETGPKQPEAIGLYIKYGYTEIDLFGEYTDCEYSLCFEKIIG